MSSDTNLVVTRCVICGRLLTDEVSVQLGIGPTCRAKWGLIQAVIPSESWPRACVAVRRLAHLREARQLDLASAAPLLSELRGLGLSDLAYRIGEFADNSPPAPPLPPAPLLPMISRGPLDVDSIFGPQGVFAARGQVREFAYEARSGQVSLVQAVDRAIREGGHLLAEAGTGTGKTVAYAVPAIFHATRRSPSPGTEDPESHVVIATANNALLEQIIKKDLPLLSEVLPWDFRYAMLKGKDNYLCLERLSVTRGDITIKKLIPDAHVLKVLKWVDAGTETGDKSELPFEPSVDTWKRFSVSSDDCTDDACKFHKDKTCYSLRARRAAKDAHVVVTNYHLLFMNFKTGGRLLPKHRVTVLDEGHKIVDIARDCLGWDLKEGSIWWVGKMLNTGSKADLALKAAASEFFDSLGEHARSPAYRVRIQTSNALRGQGLIEALGIASVEYGKRFSSLMKLGLERKSPSMFGFEDDGDAEYEYEGRHLPRSRSKRLNLGSEDAKEARGLEKRLYRIDALIDQIDEASRLDAGNVYCIKEEEGRRKRPFLSAKPIRVDEVLRERLFLEGMSTIVTSATLATSGSFDYVAGSIGARRPATLIAESPFRWGNQVLLVLPSDITVDPKDPTFPSIVADRCVEVIRQARGRTLALFTSNKNRDIAYDKAVSANLGYRLLRQDDIPRTQLIDEFRKDTHSVLFGVDSFWAGVDVPGESLSCVFIDKLPFPHKDDPILDALKARDPQWFSKYNIPPAIIAFKQGFGRLIRHTTDRGVVVCLDRRITTMGYGPLFLRSLPSVSMSTRIADIGPFLDPVPPPPPPVPPAPPSPPAPPIWHLI